ncbi:hypothetical protein [Paenibacillus macerans]|uniref:hypothetical protein n=1 Tax=Paenibacillus macerans TaxID=44252 RepID=UPI00203B4110|nr:hypothetical protein [Paenibacillus macerans]MCM3703239.1 hypothetical protein [Paenibacillus macerans]
MAGRMLDQLTAEQLFLVRQAMAEMDSHYDARDPLFAALADLAGKALAHPGMLPNNALIGYLRYPKLRRRKVEPGPLPDRYKVVINGSFPRERYLQAMEAAGHGGRIYHSRLHPDFGAPVARPPAGRKDERDRHGRSEFVFRSAAR